MAVNVRTKMMARTVFTVTCAIAAATVAWRAVPVLAQRPDPLARAQPTVGDTLSATAARDSEPEKIAPDSTAEEAAKIFRRNFVRLRAEQRAAMATAADEFLAAVEQLRSTAPPSSLPAGQSQAAEKVLLTLRTATDLETAIALVLRLRSSLEEPLKVHVTLLVDRFAELLDKSAQAKLDYRPNLAKEIVRRWDQQSIDEKRAMLAEYFSLSQESPAWLLRQRSTDIRLPLTAAAAQLLDQFESESRKELREAEKPILSERQRFIAELQEAAKAVDLTTEQSRAVASLLALLRADYASGLRGLMLCEAEPALPSAIRDRATQFCDLVQASLADLRARRTSRLAGLKQELASRRAQHLNKAEFAELMAIDLRIHELTPVVRPLWIYAFRPPRDVRPENALLLDVRDDQYLVRFRIDGYETWLRRSDVVLRPSPDAHVLDLELAPPQSGPGVALSADIVVPVGTELALYRSQAWQKVTAVDVSPFGVVVHWEGHSDQADQLVPRSHLRWLE